jgi:imidazolonepropionase-like amidohydrolase
MTPLEALRAATLDGARYLGLDRELGSIEVGKLADLVVLNANPLDDIRATEGISQVMVNGRLYEAATMNEVGSSKRRKPFYWQR